MDDSTIVTINGNAKGLQNGTEFFDENNKHYKILSIGMIDFATVEDGLPKTIFLTEGEFSSKKL